jgi:hypothetical protein
MLNNPTVEKRQAMKFTGMLKGYIEQCGDSGCEALSFDDRFGLLVERDSRRLASRLRARTQGLPRRLPRPLPPRAPALPGPRTRKR